MPTDNNNAIYIMGGGGTPVISASAFGLIHRVFTEYRSKIRSFYASVGGMRGAILEDLTDVFHYAMDEGQELALTRLKKLKYPATPVFGTSRYKPDEQDCYRLLEVFKAHGIRYVFLNGGNDTMEKAIILKEFAEKEGVELHIIGIPKTVDNDLLITHRSPGYASFAKQVALNTMSLQWDIDSFGLSGSCTKNAKVRDAAVAQVLVFMGRDAGWGAAASLIGKLDESYGPHVILTKEGGFQVDRFLARCQDAWDRYGNLLVVASEGAFDGNQYLGNHLEVLAFRHQLLFKVFEDPHKNTSVTDSRLGLFLKLLLENRLRIPTEYYSGFKCREEGPAYLNRNHLEIMSASDFEDAMSCGRRAADLMFEKFEPVDGVMVTLTHQSGKTGYTPLETVADSSRGSRAMTKSITTLDTAEQPVLSNDGMMINRDLYMNYIGDFIDLNGPNRREVLYKEGFRLPLERFKWKLVARKLPPYVKKG